VVSFADTIAWNIVLATVHDVGFWLVVNTYFMAAGTDCLKGKSVPACHSTALKFLEFCNRTRLTVSVSSISCLSRTYSTV